MVVGFALFCAILRLPYFGSIIVLELADVHSVRGILDGGILVFAAIVLPTGLREHNGKAMQATGRAISWRTYLIIAAVSVSLFVVGICALSVIRFSGAASSWLASGGAIACAGSFVLLCLLWMRALMFVQYDDLLPLALFAFTISLLLGVVDVVEGPAKAVINVLIPVGSVLCAMVGVKRFAIPNASSASPNSVVGEAISQTKITGRAARTADASVAATSAAAPNRAPVDSDSPAGSSHIILLIVLSIAFEVVCCSLVRGTWSNGGVGYSNIALLKVASYLVSAGFGIAFFIVAVYAKQPDKGAAIIGVVSLVITIILIVAIVVFGRVFFGSCTTALYSVLLVVLFPILASAAQSRFITSNVAAGIFALIFAIISLLAYTFIPNLYLYDSGKSAALVLPVALAAALIVTVGICVITTLRLRAQVKMVRSTLANATGDEVWKGVALHEVVLPQPVYISPDEALDRSVQKAAEQYRLTEREAEIVKLFAQGRTIKQAASELFLAPSTVQGYTKSIYAKLGVHGKDEIRDLLDNLS